MSNYVRLIALCGRQGSGKTTAAKRICEKFGYTRIRFADRLKKMLVDGLGIDREYIDGDRKHESVPELCGRTARHGMITLGTEWGRNNIHKDIWVMALYRDMKRLVNEGCNKFVIDDLRFLSEEKWLNSLKYNSDIPIIITIIKLEREGAVISNHQSEREIDKIKEEWTIYNSNTLEGFHLSIDDVVKRFTNKQRSK
jgi:nitrogen regulatory protein PII-like uncharacterized protein